MGGRAPFGLSTAVALCLALTACAAPVTLHEGAVAPSAWPQAAEQCQAQPDLAWCVHARQ